MFFHWIESPINAGAAAMLLGIIIVPIVSLLTPKLEKAKVEEIFTCIEPITRTKKEEQPSFDLVEDASEM